MEQTTINPSLECSLCGNPLINPKILTCSHAYCDDCADRLYPSPLDPTQVVCSTCGNNARIRRSEKRKPKPMPKPKKPLKKTNADGTPIRRLCGLCDPFLPSEGSTVCLKCGAWMCVPCAQDHEQTTGHDVKQSLPKVGRSIGSVEISQRREELQARDQSASGNGFKSPSNGNNGKGSYHPPKTSISKKGVLKTGASFPPWDFTAENWRLDILTEFHPLRSNVWCMNPSEDGGMVVGYMEGGVDIFDLKGLRTSGPLFKHVKVQGFSSLSEGRYVLRDAENQIKMYYSDGRRAAVSFGSALAGGFGGLGVDSLDNIYTGHWRINTIFVLKPHGGDVIREIPCHGFEPWDICPMHCSTMVLVSGGSMVGVLDETGRLKHEISHSGEDAYPTVLRNDQILIGWHKDGVLNIDLYSNQLKHERSVLVGFPVNSSVTSKCCLREFPSGEIALSDQDSLTIFRRIVPPVR